MRWKILPNERTYFSSDNLDEYLKELSKEFRKLNGKNMPAEITLVGGAAVLANYGFRDKTYDVDAIINASSSMKQAANNVADKFNLDNNWLNSEFKQTTSYSPKLETYSQYYKTYSNIVEFRTISAEYLVAMKLMSGRKYKNDFSDIAEIMLEHQKNGNPLSREKIDNAIENLYDDKKKIPKHSIAFLDYICSSADLEKDAEVCREIEKINYQFLSQFNDEYQQTLNDDNVNQILSLAKSNKFKERYNNAVQSLGKYDANDLVNILSDDNNFFKK